MPAHAADRPTIPSDLLERIKVAFHDAYWATNAELTKQSVRWAGDHVAALLPFLEHAVEEGYAAGVRDAAGRAPAAR